MSAPVVVPADVASHFEPVVLAALRAFLLDSRTGNFVLNIADGMVLKARIELSIVPTPNRTPSK